MNWLFEFVWFQLLTPLVLQLFVIMVLAMVAGARPETVAKSVLDFVAAIVPATVRAFNRLIRSLISLVYSLRSKRPAPRPRKPSPRRPN